MDQIFHVLCYLLAGFLNVSVLLEKLFHVKVKFSDQQRHTLVGVGRLKLIQDLPQQFLCINAAEALFWLLRVR